MKIVDVCAFYSVHGGGVKTYVDQKLKALPGLGHDITLIVPGEEDRIELIGQASRIIHLKSPTFPLDRRYRYFSNEAALHSALDRLGPDVVEASSPWSSASMVGRWRGSAVRSLVMHADPLATYAYRWLRPMMSHRWIDRTCKPWWDHLRNLDKAFDIVVSANGSLTHRLTDGGVQRAVTIPMGVEPSLFSPALRSSQLRATLLAGCGLTDDATLLIAVGRLASEKRLPLLIDAVQAAGRSQPVGLLIIGDGPERARIERHIGDNPHIRLIPPERDRKRLATLMASADALVHGCESETFGMVAAEARASGLPLIVPNVGGAFAQMTPGAAVAYDAANGRALLAAVNRVAGDRDGKMQSCARRVADQNATMATHFADLCQRYDSMLDRKSRAA